MHRIQTMLWLRLISILGMVRQHRRVPGVKCTHPHSQPYDYAQCSICSCSRYRRRLELVQKWVILSHFLAGSRLQKAIPNQPVFSQKGHIAPTTPASNNLGALMAKHGSHRPISPATRRRQLAPGSAAEEQTGRYAKDQRRAARGPQSLPAASPCVQPFVVRWIGVSQKAGAQFA